MELLKVYDKEHNYIKTISRDEAHQKDCKFFHDTIHIIVLNNSNEILVQKRSKHKKQHPYLWDLSVTGHVSSDDDLLSACQRETFEEIGLNTNKNDFKLLSQYLEKKEMEFINFAILTKKVDSNLKFNLQKEELEEIQFLSKDKFLELFNSPLFKPTSETYKKYVNQILSEIIK